MPCITHWPLFPSVFIGILALVAVAVTFRLRPETIRSEKVLWLISSFTIMHGEIWMIGNDRKCHDIEQDHIRRTEQAHFDSVTAQLSQAKLGEWPPAPNSPFQFVDQVASGQQIDWNRLNMVRGYMSKLLD